VGDDVRGRPDRSVACGLSLATLNGTAAGPAPVEQGRRSGRY